MPASRPSDPGTDDAHSTAPPPPLTLTVRALPRARTDLAGVVAALVRDAYRAAQEELFAVAVARTTPEQVARAIESGSLLVAERGDDVVGVVVVRDLDESTTYFGTLAVAPPSAGQGVARALLDHVEGRARARGHRVVSLDLLVPDPATPHQERLRRWYGRRGYTPTTSQPFAAVEPRAAEGLRYPTELVRYEKRLDRVGSR